MVSSTLIGVVIGALIAVVGNTVAQWVAGTFAEHREAKRQEHDSQMRMREERIRAYGAFLETTSVMSVEDLQPRDLFQAYSRAVIASGDYEMVGKINKLRGAALEVMKRHTQLKRQGEPTTEDPELDHLIEEANRHRRELIDAAWKQLDIEQQPTTPSEEEHDQRPWWKRVLRLSGTSITCG